MLPDLLGAPSAWQREPWLLVIRGDASSHAPEEKVLQDVDQLAGKGTSARTRIARIPGAGTFESILMSGHGRFSDVLYYGAVTSDGLTIEPTPGRRVISASIATSLRNANVAHFEIMNGSAGPLLDAVTRLYPDLRVKPPFGNSPWSLFAADRKHLAPRLIRILQPLFGRFRTDLRRVEVSLVAGGSSFTEGYDVSLMSFRDDPGRYRWALQTLLHELAHTIQGANAPGKASAVTKRRTAEVNLNLRGKEGTYEVPVEARSYTMDFWVSWKLLNPAYTIEAQAECFANLVMNDFHLPFAR